MPKLDSLNPPTCLLQKDPSRGKRATASSTTSYEAPSPIVSIKTC